MSATDSLSGMQFTEVSEPPGRTTGYVGAAATAREATQQALREDTRPAHLTAASRHRFAAQFDTPNDGYHRAHIQAHTERAAEVVASDPKNIAAADRASARADKASTTVHPGTGQIPHLDAMDAHEKASKAAYKAGRAEEGRRHQQQAQTHRVAARAQNPGMTFI